MRLRFSRGEYLPVVFIVFLILIALFAGVFWWSGLEVVTVSLDEEYFLLVRDCEDSTSAAIVGQVYSSGGAGYLYGEEVVVACYFTRRDAERVQENLTDVNLLVLKPEEFVLRGERANASAHITSNAETADSCARILFDIANGLERTELDQEEACAAVQGVYKALKGLQKQNTDSIYDAWNNVLASAELRAKELAGGILFAKDLRYLQVELCLAVSQIGNYFS